MSSSPWTPPTEPVRQEALVGCSNVLKKLYKSTFSVRQRQFYASDFFQQIQIISDADWLVNHDESGQTFESFWRSHAAGGYVTPSSRPARPQTVMSVRSAKTAVASSNGTKIIYIQPIGKFPQAKTVDGCHPFFIWLQTYCRSFFHSAKIRILPEVEIETVQCEYRVNALTGRFQLHAANILTYLNKNKPSDGHCVIAITMIDLFPKPSWDFVFGLASAARGVGVFSFARYDDVFYETWTQGNDIMSRNPDGSLDYSSFSKPVERDDNADDSILNSKLVFRACKVMSHEICHMFGLKHCIYYECVMNGSNHLQESDRRPAFLCPVCLRKLQAVLDFDVVSRYKSMLDWSDEKFWETYYYQEKRKLSIKPAPSLPLCPRVRSNRDISKRRSSLPDVTRSSFGGLSRPRTAMIRNGQKKNTANKSKQAAKVLLPIPQAKMASPKTPVAETDKKFLVPSPPLEGFEEYREWLRDVIKYMEEKG